MRRTESVAFLTLLSFALGSSRPAEALEEGVRDLRCRRLRRAAGVSSAALREGRPIASALEGHLPGTLQSAVRAGEQRGDLPGGVERAMAQARQDTKARNRLLGPALHPLVSACLIVAMGGIVGAASLPAVASLRRETALLAGRPEPGGLLAVLADHAWALAAAGLAAALVPLLAPLVAGLAGRVPAMGRLLLRLPLAGRAARHRAAAAFSSALGDHLEVGTPLDAAWLAAARTVPNAALRRALLRSAERVGAGDPVPWQMKQAGLPSLAVAAFGSPTLAADGGKNACRMTARRAAEEAERLAAAGGRLAAALGYTVAALALILLAWAVYLPLAGTGAL